MNGQPDSPGRTWRLLYDCTPQPGACNMAWDEVLLGSIMSSLPTLRLYAWSPACLSLGYGQRAADADPVALAEHGVDLVRRATGGKAILHTDELTYSLTWPPEHALAALSVVESYRAISAAIVCALEMLGVNAVEAEAQTGETMSSDGVCFRAPSHYEVTYGGRKLVGSAQVRRKTGMLQHGTLPLVGDLGRICEVLAYPDDEARDDARRTLYARACTLEQAAGRVILWDEVAHAFRLAFEQTFGVQLAESGWTDGEHAQASELAETQFGSAGWTWRR